VRPEQRLPGGAIRVTSCPSQTSSLRLAGDRFYIGNVEGSMTVLRAGRQKELLGQIEMDAPLYSRPASIGDALYLATANRLYLIASKP
jgi:hypothetical protein